MPVSVARGSYADLMLRVRLRGRSIGTVVAGSGETIAVGRAPEAEPNLSPDAELQTTAVALPDAAHHVSRTAFRVQVGAEVVRLRYLGQGEAQLSSLFDAPAGARRVTLVDGMTALLDEGENQLVLLRGAVGPAGGFTDLTLSIDVTALAEVEDQAIAGSAVPASLDRDGAATTAAPTLERFGREWFVALALAEPWLVGQDDYPRPPSNREIFERVTQWNRYAWNLSRPQRVDDSIKIISRLAFGPADDPFAASAGRSQNIRFAVGRRAAEVRLVTPDDLAEANRRSAERSQH